MSAADPDLLATIASAVRASVPGVVSVYLFGSAAEARTHRDSDVDVAILMSHDLAPRAADRFEARLAAVTRLRAALGRDADVVMLNDAPPQLARRILTDGQRVLIEHADKDSAFRRVVLSRAADLEPFLRRMRRIKLAALAR
jgi:predicted nucleotidyltransferase